jgi:two-component sensor histidine kinase
MEWLGGYGFACRRHVDVACSWGSEMSMTGQKSESQRLALTMVEEINHRVMNEYTEAIASLSLAGKGVTDLTSREILANAGDRLRAHAAAHRALLRPNATGLIDVGEYVEQVCRTISSALLDERGATMLLETEEVLLSADRCWRLGLIVAELVRNAVRHGLADRNGSIVVRLTRRGDALMCLVSNDGNRGSPLPGGRGRQLVAVLADEIGGSVEWNFTPAGAHVQLEAPLDDLIAL